MSDYPLRFDGEGICEVIGCHEDDADRLRYRLAPSRLYAGLKSGYAVPAGLCYLHAAEVSQPTAGELKATHTVINSRTNSNN